MKILLVNPPRVDGYSVVREERYEHRDMGSCYPPLQLLEAGAFLQSEGHEVRLVDANGGDLSPDEVLREAENFEPGLVYGRVAFDCQEEDSGMFRALGQATGAPVLVRNKIIAGTPWLKKNLLEKCQAAAFVEGEAEGVLAETARSLEKGSSLTGVKGLTLLSPGGIHSSPDSPKIDDLESLPTPAYGLLDGASHYHTGLFGGGRFGLLALTRGCPFSCSFCAYRKTGYRQIPPERAVEHITRLVEEHGLSQFLFFDDIIALQPLFLEEFSERLIAKKLKIQWSCCTRAELMPRGALALMKKAGLVELAVGIESGAEEILQGMDKGNGPQDVRRLAADCHDLDVLFYGMCILGLPGETHTTAQKTVDLIRETRPFYTQFGFAVPYPNTPMWNWYEERGYILTKDFSRFNPLSQTPVIRTEALSAEELTALKKKVYRQTSLSFSHLWKQIRWGDPLWNLRGLRQAGGRMVSLVTGSKIR